MGDIKKVFLNYTGINLLKPAIADFALSEFYSSSYLFMGGSGVIGILNEEQDNNMDGIITIANVLDKHISKVIDDLKKKYNPAAVDVFVVTESQLSGRLCQVIHGMMDQSHSDEIELYLNEPTEFELNPRYTDLIYYICQENFIITDKSISPLAGPISSVKIKKRRKNYD